MSVYIEHVICRPSMYMFDISKLMAKSAEDLQASSNIRVIKL